MHFCCQPQIWNELTSSCRWADCGVGCAPDETQVTKKYREPGKPCPKGLQYEYRRDSYCCKKSEPIPFKNCDWLGKGDCADNQCSESDTRGPSKPQLRNYGPTTFRRCSL